MAQHQFRVAEVEVSRSPTDEKILAFYRYDSPHPNRKGSTTLIVAEITSTLYAYERLLDVLNSTTEQLRHLTAAVEQDPVSRFEKLVQRINESLTLFLRGEATPISWSRVSIFIIDLCDNQLCITGIGRLMNVFLQKQDDDSYKNFDLLGSLEQPQEINSEKPFTSLICGDINPGDILVVGSTNFERLRHELAIRERLISLPPVSAAMEIKQDLEYRSIPDDFLAVIVSCISGDNPKLPAAQPYPTEREANNSTASINRLRETEEETHSHLSPALRPSAGGQPSKKPASLGSRVLAHSTVAGFMGMIQKVRSAVTRAPLKDARAMTSLRGMSAGHGTRFTRKQIMMVAGIGLSLVAVVSGALLWRGSARRATAEKAWQTAYEKALDNRNRAESDLVYANDARARKEIDTALAIAGTLDVKEPEHAQKINQLKGDLNQLRERLRKLMPAEPLTELLALSGVPDGTLVAPVLTKDAAYAVDNSTRSVMRINLQTKEAKRIQLPENSDPIVSGSRGKASVVFATGKGKLYGVDMTSHEVAVLGSLSKSSSTTDIVVYAGRLYRLDGPAGQLWRGQGSIGSNESAYIKASNTDLSNAVSVAIDSNVYILSPSGNVARFLSGGQDGFTLNAIDPPLRAATGIWTNVDAQRIVITDPADKRVAVFNKDGTLKAQLTSPQFTAPRDVDGDEVNHRLIVIDGTRLLLIPLP